MVETFERRMVYERMKKAELIEALLALEDTADIGSPGIFPAAMGASSRAEILLVDAIENLSEGLFLYDKDSRLIHGNKKFKEQYGYSDADLVGAPTLSQLLVIDVAPGNRCGARRRYRCDNST